MFVLSLALVGAAVRVVRGPNLADRVVSLDLTVYVAVCMTAVGAVLTEAGPLLDVALVLSLLGFLSTVAFARFLERVNETNRDDP